MLRLIFTRPLTRQLAGSLRCFRPVRITSSPGIVPRTPPRRSLGFTRNSSTGRSHNATELDKKDFRAKSGYPCSYINSNCSYPCSYWGFVIIRTTYTPESDLQWPVAMAKLSDWLRLEMKEKSDASAEDQEHVVGKFRNLIAEDKAKYDGMPMNDAVLRFEDILKEQIDIAMKYSTQEHFEKTWLCRIPELVEQSLVESDPEVKRDLLEASYWHLNQYICLVIDDEVLKDLVEFPCFLPQFDLAEALKEIREHPDGPPPDANQAHLKVAMRHTDFELVCWREGFSADDPNWYTQWGNWANWAVRNGLGEMHWSIRSSVLHEGGIELELLDGKPYVEIWGQE
ncbi:hypothetical protein V499_07620 [Pseudogymnoascus sp. VKM F-103]|nr:hypothetical protein V499_07620 [Pseudogymnoascus sp. VKM F-103]